LRTWGFPFNSNLYYYISFKALKIQKRNLKKKKKCLNKTTRGERLFPTNNLDRWGGKGRIDENAHGVKYHCGSFCCIIVGEVCISSFPSKRCWDRVINIRD